MANYHFTADYIGRARGQSSVRSAAYGSGQRITDQRTGEIHDYTGKGKRGVLYSEIVMPGAAGDWKPSRAELWNANEKAHTRGDAQTARTFEVSLPHELDEAQRRALGLDLAKYIAEKFGVAVDIAFHRPDPKGDERNWHMHLITTAKQIKGPWAFGTKAIGLDPVSMQRNKGEKNGVEILREVWATLANDHLAKAGRPERIDHRTLEAQGIDREATTHIGPNAKGMERDRQKETDRGDMNRATNARNQRREDLKAEHANITAQIIDLKAERAARQDGRADAFAARTLDPAHILESLTRNNATFTRKALEKSLSRSGLDEQARREFAAKILSRGDVVPLRENATAPISRYTTRDVLAGERQVLNAAQTLAQNSRHGVDTRRLGETLDQHSHLDAEQRRAFDHATKAGGLALIAGQAGTGKSTTASAIREAYESAGYKVRGMAWTHDVVTDMSRSGFKDAETVARELRRQENGRGDWNAKTVLMVDEAGQLSSKALASLLTNAANAGAKVILTGDHKQLSSIERGGMFEQLQRHHGAAELTKVYRAKHDDDKAAFNAMHRGDWREALGLFDKRGSLNWSENPDAARAALVEKWAELRKAEPEKFAAVYAYTNREVNDLNRDLRAIRKERRELGEDHILKTRQGEAAFAKGDRVQFTATATSRKQQQAGLYNGAKGTITGIEENRLTVALDHAAKNGEKSVSFTVGTDASKGEFDAIRHAYASTIYKGQGKTNEKALLLHSDQWRANTAYVAESRAIEKMEMFIAEKPGAWMMQAGGLDKLDPRGEVAARRSFAAWAEQKPELAAKYGVADYVAYVQGQWAEQKDMNRLDRLARQLGRPEDNRAASAFTIANDRTPPGSKPAAEQPAIYSRYDALRAFELRHNATERRQARPAQAAANDAANQQPVTLDYWGAVHKETLKAHADREEIRELRKELGLDRGKGGLSR